MTTSTLILLFALLLSAPFVWGLSGYEDNLPGACAGPCSQQQQVKLRKLAVNPLAADEQGAREQQWLGWPSNVKNEAPRDRAFTLRHDVPQDGHGSDGMRRRAASLAELLAVSPSLERL